MLLPEPHPITALLMGIGLLAHVGLGEGRLVPVGRLQYALQWLYAAAEPTALRVTDWLIRQRWASETRPGRALLQALAIASRWLPHGEVLTTDAAVRLAHWLEAVEGPKGARLAVGPCVCQRALGRWKEPSCKDVVLLYGAEVYTRLEVGYRLIDAEEAAAIFRRCGEAGLVHTADFCMQSGRWTFVVCNCDAEICVLTRAHKLTGRFLVPGPERTVHDPERCRGAAGCGACIEACMFDAMAAREGRVELLDDRCLGCGRCVDVCPGALSMEPRPGGGHLPEIR